MELKRLETFVAFLTEPMAGFLLMSEQLIVRPELLTASFAAGMLRLYVLDEGGGVVESKPMVAAPELPGPCT